MDSHHPPVDTDEQATRRYPTLGADAATLVEVDHVETDAGELLVYEENNEEAWIQSDIYADRADLV